jgi:hypothetical protein
MQREDLENHNDDRRQRFLQAANLSYERLRKRKVAWEDELMERKLWERTLADHLKD